QIRELQRSLDIFNPSLQTILICTVPIILAILIFKYLNSNKATTMMHSLPCSRNTLYASHCLAGLCLLLLPVLLIGLLLLVLNLTTSLHEYYSLLNILQWMGLTGLYNTLFFFVTVFVGMFTGNSIAQLIFTYIFHVLPAGLYLLLVFNLEHLLYGYSSVALSEAWLEHLPLFTLFSRYNSANYFTPSLVAIYLALIVFFCLFSAYLYQRRALETAGNVISFSLIEPVFKYGVTFCTMLLSGALFSAIYNDSLPLLLFGYLLGSLLGYWIAEALLQKSIRVWSAHKGYWGYAAIIVLLLIGISLDITGFEHKVPELTQVESVYFGPNINFWLTNEAILREKDSETEYKQTGDIGFFSDQNNIENIALLHQELVSKPTPPKQGRRYYFAYNLSNGKHLLREYVINEKQEAPFLKPIYESLEYKEARFPVLTQDTSEIKLIELDDRRTAKKPLLLTDSTEIEELTKLLKLEILATTSPELIYPVHEYIYITILNLHDGKINYALRSDYQSIFRWLQEKGYTDNFMLLPEDINYVTLENPEKSQQDEQKVEPLKITEQEMIEELTRLTISQPYYYRYDSAKIYEVTFYGMDGKETYRFNTTISKDLPISPALKTYLKQLD
ncbi:MAG TPA: ABC transporter permease, partial [Clostridia bacterium]|nr:ABC transporter permease [Clostridia bacterium]